jgi:hypothetical protein
LLLVLLLRSATIGIGNGERGIDAARSWMMVTIGNIDASSSYSDEGRAMPQHRRRSTDVVVGAKKRSGSD